MSIRRRRSIFLCLALPFGFSMTAIGQESPVIPVSSVDLNQYTGLWYEITKIPNRFQKQCAFGTTAEYSLLPDGKIQVINRCRQSQDEEDSIKGVARVVDTKTNAKLQVSFVRFLCRNWFWGDYWIIGLDEQYQWAVVGTPNRRYGWILARTKSLTESDQQKCFDILRRQGYNPDDFVATPQE